MRIRVTRWQVAGALILSACSFLFGFCASRYVIDLSLRQTDTVLLRSAAECDRLEEMMAREYRIEYEHLRSKVNAITPGKETHR